MPITASHVGAASTFILCLVGLASSHFTSLYDQASTYTISLPVDRLVLFLLLFSFLRSDWELTSCCMGWICCLCPIPPPLTCTVHSLFLALPLLLCLGQILWSYSLPRSVIWRFKSKDFQAVAALPKRAYFKHKHSSPPLGDVVRNATMFPLSPASPGVEGDFFFRRQETVLPNFYIFLLIGEAAVVSACEFSSSFSCSFSLFLSSAQMEPLRGSNLALLTCPSDFYFPE